MVFESLVSTILTWMHERPQIKKGCGQHFASQWTELALTFRHDYSVYITYMHVCEISLILHHKYTIKIQNLTLLHYRKRHPFVSSFMFIGVDVHISNYVHRFKNHCT
jgi:hypothetical protein